ncbi:MAG: hypothetical protein JRF02_00405, partial [Deltaproteobacteria bacterium]|nr:hypothetical protein [Deltaproteobacteria bacterium]
MRRAASAFLVATLSALILACTGQLTGVYSVTDEEDVDTYYSQGQGDGEPMGDGASELQLDVESAIAVLPQCEHNGELQLAMWLGNTPWNWDWDDPAPQEQPSVAPTVLSLEAASGELLGSTSLKVEEMVAALPAMELGTIQSFVHPMQLSISAELVAAGAFAANLYACLDTDADGSCADE